MGKSQWEAKYLRSMGVTRPEPAVTDGKCFKGVPTESNGQL